MLQPMLDVSQPIPLILVLLAAAVLIVTLFRRLGLSAILGYLVAGALVGPYGLGVIQNVKDIVLIAELGVVFLLFVIGSELSLERMHSMRHQVFGIGGAQILISGAVICFLAYSLGLSLESSILIGLGLALSSTALVLQVIREKREQNTPLGRMSLSILLMQDMAVVPLLVLVPLLATDGASVSSAIVSAAVNAVLALALVFIGGRLLLRPLLRHVAALGHAEIFSAFTLLVVLGIAWGFHAANLSMALGAFIAGLLVAETEFKHQVEADIMPFKGLLLGLFFMVVGMKVDFSLIFHEFVTVMSLVFALMVGKAAIIVALCRWSKFHIGGAIHTALLLSQGGEFGFIVFGQALEHGLLSESLSQLLMLVIAISMALTPVAYLAGKTIAEKIRKKPVLDLPDDEQEVLDMNGHVLVIGYGRVGQTVGRLLEAENIDYIALDTDPMIVGHCRKKERPIYYGDGARREVLHAVSVHTARAAVVTINDFQRALRAIRTLKAQAPSLPVIVRTSDLQHLLQLEDSGADVAVSEMFEASLQLGAAVLRQMNITEQEITRVVEMYRDQDYALTRADEFSPCAEVEERTRNAGTIAQEAAKAMEGGN